MTSADIHPLQGRGCERKAKIRKTKRGKTGEKQKL
jgi:hypothetical protein